MAQLYSKVINNGELLCYSERGAISYLMTSWILDKKNLDLFIKNIENNKGLKIPTIKYEKYYPVSEIVFGNAHGFGSPDGVLIIESSNNKTIFFIEAKFNSTYDDSCKKDKGNSRINKQFELKNKFIQALYGKRKDTKRIESSGKALILKEGIGLFCEQYLVNENKSVQTYFLAITDDVENPFKNKKDYENYCWIGKKELLEIIGLKIKE